MVSPDVLRDVLRPGNSVLVVWDVHKALFNGIFNKDEFQRALNTAISAARRANVPIIFTKITPYPSGFEPVNTKIMPWRGGFRPEDMELIVQPQPNDIVINKNTWSLFVGTNVELLLRNSGRYTVVLTGIATEIGVETTARHAYALGFIPVIISDAVSSYNREAHERSLTNMRAFFPVITAEELSKYWS
ncbi:MAG: cysteine hydrolase family protein [Vulcanisaeta sp. AZ3]